jgi:endonuclease G
MKLSREQSSVNKTPLKSKIAVFLTGALLGAGVAQIPSIQPSIEFIPVSHPVITRKAYTLTYDGKTRNPSWVYEKLSQETLQKNAKRDEMEFLEDLSVPVQTTNADYLGSGFDRGHLCPAADARISEEALKETFYLSNVTPQHPQFNRGFWLQLEKHARTLTEMYDTVHVTSGPLFLPNTEEEGKQYVKYQVIGKNHVAVPTHYFKVIQCVSKNSIETQAFIVPHQPIAKETPLSTFSVPLSNVEKAAGIKFQH